MESLIAAFEKKKLQVKFQMGKASMKVVVVTLQVWWSKLFCVSCNLHGRENMTSSYKETKDILADFTFV